MAARLLPTDDPPSIRLALIAFAIFATVALILLPLGMVVAGAFQKGTAHVIAVFADPATGSAIRLTLLVIAGTLPLNAVFGFGK